jgi:hypothetical protein
MVNPVADDIARATAFIKRGCRLGRIGVTCKIFAARLGHGGVDGTQRDFACVVERVDRTWVQHFRGRRASMAAEHGLVMCAGQW